MTLLNAEEGREYTVVSINTDDISHLGQGRSFSPREYNEDKQDVGRSPWEIIISPPRWGTSLNKLYVLCRKYSFAEGDWMQNVRQSACSDPGPTHSGCSGGGGFFGDQKIGSMANAQTLIP